MENENKILFKEILEKYKTVRTPLKNLFRVEDCMSWSILFVTAVVLGFLFWFACTENNHCMFATTVIYVVIVVGYTVCLFASLYNKKERQTR